jgi:uncharacterized membrane protein YedE/YeeE
MAPADLSRLTTLVLAGTFGLACVLGAVIRRTHFCTMGAIADWSIFGDTTRLRQWALAIAVALLGTQLLAAAGVLDLGDTYFTAQRLNWLALPLGGLLFGFGMVLAGGCGSKLLVRAGGGSLKALIALLVLGIVAYISLRGALALLRVHVLEAPHLQFATRQDLPALLAGATALPVAILHLLLGGGLALLLGGWALADAQARRFDSLLAGVAIGGVIVAMWLLSGTVGRVEEHPQTLERAYLATQSGKLESLSFVGPLAWSLDWLMFTSDAGRRLTLGIVAVAGMLTGAAAQALWARDFRWEGFADTGDTARHLTGAALMGFGGVTALGCTIGQGLSGLSTLSLGSVLAVAGIFGGALLGLRYQQWQLARSPV